MDRKQRIFWKDGATLRDVSDALGDYRRTDLTFDVQAGEHVYIGTELPFNHRYVDSKVANDVASLITVEIWNGSAWVAAVDVNDGTDVAGASMAQDGFISFVPDIDHTGWNPQRDSKDVTGLETTRIFGLYWSRLSWSVSLKSTTALSYIGLRFSDDTDLGDFYPDTKNADLKAAFESGKTDWKAQSFAAAEAIVQDLRKQSIVIRGEQILDPTLFTMASVHKTAALIYMGISNYRDRAEACEKAYREAMSIKFFEVDKNADGRKDVSEVTFQTGYLSR